MTLKEEFIKVMEQYRAKSKLYYHALGWYNDDVVDDLTAPFMDYFMERFGFDFDQYLQEVFIEAMNDPELYPDSPLFFDSKSNLPIFDLETVWEEKEIHIARGEKYSRNFLGFYMQESKVEKWNKVFYSSEGDFADKVIKANCLIKPKYLNDDCICNIYSREEYGAKSKEEQEIIS